MFKKTLLSALAVSVIAASAQAASPVSAVNAGKGQLARAAGVSASEFTTAELMRLIDAQRTGDTSEVAFILSHENRTEANPASAVTPGEAQLAAAAGVSASEFTTAELMRLIDAQRAGDTSEVAFILSHENRTEANPASAVTPGEAQLAAAAGVDPAKYTLDELVALQSWSDD